MKLKEFKKKMKKNVFSVKEAHILCFDTTPNLVNLQLHQWKKSGDILSLKRGVYIFADTQPSSAEIAKALYSPCYFSLEYVLNFYGIMPETVFQYTLLTPKATRRFDTPFGIFNYQSIKKAAFFGFDDNTLMAEKEKALVDYFYFNSANLEANDKFWKSLRLEVCATNISSKKALSYSKLFNSAKLNLLLTDFFKYAKSYQTG